MIPQTTALHTRPHCNGSVSHCRAVPAKNTRQGVFPRNLTVAFPGGGHAAQSGRQDVLRPRNLTAAFPGSRYAAQSGGQGALLPRNLTVAFPGNRQWNDRYAGSAAKSRRRQGLPRRRQTTCLCKQVKISRDICRRPNRRKYPGMCARRRRAARRCFHPAALYSLNAQSTGRAAMTACALVRSP